MDPPVMMHPPDRSHIATEHRNPRSMDLDRLSIAECVALMNREDATVAAAVARAAPAITAFIAALVPRFGAGGRLIYLGAGTSGRLGVLDASECPPTFQVEPDRVVGIIAGGDASLRKSSEGREDERSGAHAELTRLGVGPRDTVVGIAAGGTTPYVLGALEYAKARGSLTGMLTCAPFADGAPGFIDHPIVVETGPEVLTGSTRLKAGTATKTVLNTITTTLMVHQGKCYENLMIDLRASNAKLRDRAARIVATATGLDRSAALALLDEAGGAAKSAIVMHHLRVSRPDAERALDAHGGSLRVVLERGAAR
jgi:N-acetylmuramic acid 6-phosphate etherase